MARTFPRQLSVLEHPAVEPAPEVNAEPDVLHVAAPAQRVAMRPALPPPPLGRKPEFTAPTDLLALRRGQHGPRRD